MEKIAGQSIIDSLEIQFDAFEKSLNGQSQTAAHQLRKKAFENLVANGFPSVKSEEYKFTNFTRAIEKNFDLKLNTSPPELTAEHLAKVEVEGLDAYRLVFVNGVYNESLSDEIAEDGIKTTPLVDAFKGNTAAIADHFGKTANFEEDAFVALNTAFSQHGIAIEIASKAVISKPIVLYYMADATNTEVSFHARNLINVGQFAEATVIEKFDTIGGHKSFTTIVNEITIAENAQFQYFKVENDTELAYHISNVYARQASSSNFKTFTFSLNGAMVRNNLHIKIEGEGIDTYMNGLYLLKGRTHVDNHTVADHTKPNCHSSELYKGIVDDSAKAVFNGKIFVRQEAQKTNAFQSNKNILLSDHATINTKPQLEIWADDVSCSHGCTIGQLDLDALFYLQARGIKKDKAKVMLLNAFASDVLATVANDAIKIYLEEIIKNRLEK
ncbi:MAG: Fe-S cluster assembly protein SufD [Roseivirga sp.]|jgi:Fe-S cluster assembly protein SufD